MRMLVFTALLSLCLFRTGDAAPPSPAGGEYLRIYEQGDYATVPDHDDLDVTLQTDGFTIEMWVYLERPLKERVDAIAQPLDVWSLLYKDESYRWDMFPPGSPSFNFTFREGFHAGGLPGLLTKLPLKEWHYIAVTFAERYRQYCVNNRLRGTRGILLRFDNTDGPLRIGGGRKPLLGVTPGPFLGKPVWVDFTGGLIDEVRISNVVRYPADGIADKKWNEVWEKTIEIPKGRFETDEHTIALWHFDWEGEPGSKWRDASGNGHHLTYTGNYLHVNPHRKLATTWAGIKGR